jgi:succinyl-diaminopimelate desuccinylase
MTLSVETAARLAARIEGYRDEMVQFQCRLTAVTALGPENGGDGEWLRSRHLVEQLLAFGLDQIEEVDAPDPRVSTGVRPNLVVRVRGVAARPAVWVLAHMDTVPPGEFKLWDSDPFRAVVRDGRIIGRGVEDNQQGLTAGVFALRALLDEGLTPATDVGLVLVADEETGNHFGVEYMLETIPDLVHTDDLVVVPDAGSPDGSVLEVAEKSTLWIEFTVHGRQVHASIPDAGVNAHRAAAHLAVRLDERLPAAFPLLDPVFDVPQSTFEPTRRDANVQNVNTIPGEDHFYFDCRVLPAYALSDVKAVVGEIVRGVEGEFGVTVEIAYPAELPAAPPTPVDAPVVQALAEAVRAVKGVEPRTVGIGGGTVAAVFRRRGIPAVVWASLEETAHSPNEYCVIDNLVGDALVLAHLFARGL